MHTLEIGTHQSVSIQFANAVSIIIALLKFGILGNSPPPPHETESLGARSAAPPPLPKANAGDALGGLSYPVESHLWPVAQSSADVHAEPMPPSPKKKAS